MVSSVNLNNVYTDLSGLNAISVEGRKDTAAGLKQVAKQFEALFLNMMLKSMREGNKAFSEGNYLNSNEMEFYQQNFDNQISLHLSAGKGIGLADSLYRQLMNQFEVSDSASDETNLEQRAPIAVPIRTTVEVGEQDVRSSVMDVSGQGKKLPIVDVGDTAEVEKDFLTPQQFIEYLLPAATAAAEKLGVDPKVLLAQSALETGWGQKILKHTNGESSRNLFGIKADARWTGNKANANTVEYRNGIATQEVSSFRSYSTYSESFDDYVNFLRSSPRYQSALDNASNPERYVNELQKSGYATDPIYAEKISRVLNSKTMQTALAQVNNETF